MTVSDI